MCLLIVQFFDRLQIFRAALLAGDAWTGAQSNATIIKMDKERFINGSSYPYAAPRNTVDLVPTIMYHLRTILACTLC